MKNLYLPGILATLLLAAFTAEAQSGSVGIGTATPDASAALDLSATGKGLLIPRLDSAARVGIAAPATGLLVFQTGPRQGFYYYSGSAWLWLPDKARGGDNLGNHAATQALNLQGNALTGTGDDLGNTVGIGVRADGGLNIGQRTAGGNVLIGYRAGPVLSAATGGYRNTFLGYASGFSATTGGDNVFTGYYSGLSNTSGFQNAFSGSFAGRVNSSGSRNAFFGFSSGVANTTGGSNAFFGSLSGAANTLGSSNSFFGYLSGENNTVGELNVFVGTYSGQSSTTGSRNAFVGSASGYNNGNGQNNWALGYDAGPAVGGLTNAGALGYRAQVSQSNSLVLGGTGANAVSVGVGTTAPAASALLDLSATNKGLLIPRLDSVARVGISSPATGLLVFQTGPRQGFYYYSGSAWLWLPDKARGGDNLGNHTATQALSLGANALVGNGAELGSVVGLGVRADGGLNLGQNSTGNSVYLGYRAGVVNTGTYNQFVGVLAGNANTTGSCNIFSGYESGFLNTTGAHNTFSGLLSGGNNSTGSYNTFTGRSSGRENLAGSYNTFDGAYSGNTNTTGNNNTALGYNSGYYYTTGSNNTALGYNSGPAYGNGAITNATALGANVTLTQSNTVVLGNGASVGIGTAAPVAPLEVQAGTALTGTNTGTEPELRLTRPGTSNAKWNASAELALGTYATGINSQSQLDFRLGDGFNNNADQTVLSLRGDGRAEVARKITTPATGAANVLAAAYGNVFGAGTLANATSNVSVGRTGNAGEYLLTFTGPLATADFGSTALSLTLFNGPGFVSYTSGGSAGRLLVRTYNVSGTLTDRGFSFVVFQP